MEEKKMEGKGEIIMAVIVIIFLVLIAGRGALVDEQVAINTMEAQGFSDVEVKESAWLFVGFRGCGNDDAAKFEVSATNPNGQRVDCIVCADWPFKGSTIRYK